MNIRKKIIGLLCAILPLTASAQRQVDQDMLKTITVMAIINSMYVDTISNSKLAEYAIQGMLKELDPHSSYIPKKDVQAANEPLQGSFEGIGVQFNINEDTLVVIQPVSNGPSEKVGIIAGDKIVTVNDTAIAGVKMSRTDIMKRLRGKKGTKVRLGIMRQGIKGLQEFVVTRDKIPVHTIDAWYMIDATTGYIRIESFGATTHEEFVAAAAELMGQGMKDLVLDLQGNGGGYLSAAVDMADEFLSDGEMIVYTDGRVTGRHEYHAHKGSMNIDRIIVLVDGYSASAAEILSGAIQDNDRGTIVGRRTFGKGLVQQPRDLPDGSQIRLTVSHFYSPVGRCFQKPYVKGDKKKYEQDMLDRLNSGELMSADSIHFPDSLKYTTKGGRTVYGGGGIMPDVYVPLDTTIYTRLHRELSAKSCIIQTSLKYMDKYRKPLIKQYEVEAYRKAKAKKNEKKTYKQEDMTRGFANFKENFEVPQEMIDMLLARAKEAKIEYTDSMLQASMPLVKLQLKALLARDLWDMSEYFQIMNPANEIYKAGLKALKEE